MKELKDGRLLSGIRISEAPNHGGANLDLDVLADQLSSIASEIRRSQLSLPGEKFGNGNTVDFPILPQASNLGDRKLGFADEQKQRAFHAEAARLVYAKRRRRTSLFGNNELFGEPAWDILLDLFIAHAEGKPVSVSSACIGSAAPPTTGLRWLGVLAENNLILREHDPDDQRRVLVRLTDRGLTAMDEYFSASDAAD